MNEPPASAHRLAPGVWIEDADLRLQTSRSSGPGGQAVNKISSAVEIWAPVCAIAGMSEPARARLRLLAGSRLTQSDEVHLRAQDSRSQRDNRDIVLRRLAELVARARTVPPVRRKTKPSRAAKARRVDAKKRVGLKKQLRRDRGN